MCWLGVQKKCLTYAGVTNSTMTDKSKRVPCACDRTLESEPASGTISLTGDQHEEPWVNERWIQALRSSALQAESAKVRILSEPSGTLKWLAMAR